MKKPTLRFQLIRGFLILIAGMALLLYYQNYYAMRVVRDEVSLSTSRVLSLQSGQIDRTLEETGNYLLRLLLSDDSGNDLIALSSYPREYGEYVFAKIRLQADLVNGQGGFDNILSFFAYAAEKEDFVFSQISYSVTEQLRQLLSGWMRDERFAVGSWQVLRGDDQNYLARVDRAVGNAGVYVGAIVRVNDLLAALRKLDEGEQWDAVMLDAEGRTLTDTAMPAETTLAINRKLLDNPRDYQVFRNPSDDKKYLLVSVPFRQAPVNLAAIVAEEELMQRLPSFQYVILLIPAALLVIFYFYSLFLKRVLLVPLHQMIKGMRKVADGELEIQLQEARTEELYFLTQTFNRMVEQTRNLKINVYEEMLRTKQAEFKHLQAQINPHFYLNSLNIIYSLSLLEENALIRKMTELLVDYFRFITRSNRDTVTVEEELNHIRNYLDIQAMRFPDKLTYEIRVDDALTTHPIFPLMLQPFVENAVVHGMEEKAPFHIAIDVGVVPEEAGRFAATIRDNGKGFAPDTLLAFNRCQFGDGTGKHLGVWNVHRRLQMMYADGFSLSFDNAAPKGTVVRLSLPAAGGSTDNKEAKQDAAAAADRR